jgi:hypothetical protein
MAATPLKMRKLLSLGGATPGRCERSALNWRFRSLPLRGIDSRVDYDEIIARLVSNSDVCRAHESDDCVPHRAGLYAIFLDTPQLLPAPFSTRLLSGNERQLIYIGIATKSLQARLVKQDLRHKSPSTFFRGLGAILGYMPRAGSLIGRRNQNNYRFSPDDTRSIIEWINSHVFVRWVESTDCAVIERLAIPRYNPILKHVAQHCSGQGTC